MPQRMTAFGDARCLNEEELNRLPKQTLLTLARDESLPNRSKMNKAQLARTLRKHFRSGAA
jgi:hypothetical protein